MTAELWTRLDAAVPGGPGSDAELARERRELTLFGLPFELCLMPERAAREGIPSAVRPAFAPGRGPRIRRDEAFWGGEGLVATPNRFPFYWRQLLLWPADGTPREVDRAFLERSFEVAAEVQGTLLVNTIGASASIPLAHGHLIELAPRLLAELPLVEVAREDGVRFLATDAGSEVPFLVVAVHSADVAARARWARRLLDLRRTPAVNLLARGDRVWIVPRRAEVPSVGFPFAIGAGELSGRFIFPREDLFRGALAGDLETALREATVPMMDAQIETLRRAIEQTEG